MAQTAAGDSMILLDQAGAGADGARFFPSSPAHAPWLEYFWAQRSDAAPAGRSWRLVPELNPHLIFTLARAGSRRQVRCVLVGPRSRFADVAMAGRTLTFGACLRPGALPLLTRLPASDFTDQAIPVEAVFGAQGRSLVERLGELASCHAALDTIAPFLAEAWTGQGRRANLPLEGCTRVAELAARAGLPGRTLHARLKQEVGLSPKRILRIQR